MSRSNILLNIAGSTNPVTYSEKRKTSLCLSFKPRENGSKYRTFKDNVHNVIKAKIISESQPTATNC